MADEIELKLDLTPEAANALEAAALLPGNPDIAEQRSSYFDTPDHRLSKAGLSLRIRRSGKKRIQTVKADGASAAGLFMRSEWERPVDSDTPVLDDTTPIRALLGGATDTIAPAFEVWIERRTWIIGEGEATIELVKDARLESPRFTTPGPVTRHLDAKGYEVTTGIGPDLMTGAKEAVAFVETEAKRENAGPALRLPGSTGQR